jgi:hypothetical protein
MIPATGKRRPEASRYLQERYGIRCTPATLANYAARGIGPLYRLVSKFAVYEDED